MATSTASCCATGATRSPTPISDLSRGSGPDAVIATLSPSRSHSVFAAPLSAASLASLLAGSLSTWASRPFSGPEPGCLAAALSVPARCWLCIWDSVSLSLKPQDSAAQWSSFSAPSWSLSVSAWLPFPWPSQVLTACCGEACTCSTHTLSLLSVVRHFRPAEISQRSEDLTRRESRGGAYQSSLELGCAASCRATVLTLPCGPASGPGRFRSAHTRQTTH